MLLEQFCIEYNIIRGTLFVPKSNTDPATLVNKYEKEFALGRNLLSFFEDK